MGELHNVICVPNVSHLLTIATYLSGIPERCKLRWREFKYTPVDSAFSVFNHWYYGTTGLKVCDYIEKFVEDMEVYLAETPPHQRSDVLMEMFRRCPIGIQNLRTTYSKEDGKLKVCARLTHLLELVEQLLRNSA